MNDEERFWANVDRNGPIPIHRPELGPCWIWLAGKIKGYGHFRVGKTHIMAHRFSYQLKYGSIPEGLQSDHLCRVKSCVNPDHLEVVTSRENTLRGFGPTAINFRKAECISGHRLEPSNLIQKNGWRECRACKRRRRRESMRRKRADAKYRRQDNERRKLQGRLARLQKSGKRLGH